MAAENIVQVLIRFGLKKEAAEEAVKEIKKIEVATAAATDETAKYETALRRMAEAEKSRTDAQADAARQAELSTKIEERKRLVAEETAQAEADLAKISKTYTDEEVVAVLEASRAQDQLADRTKRTFASKKELKDMVKQLGQEFPLLGMAGRLALNPIVAVTTGITTAFSIWKLRVDGLTQSLGGIEMPDISEDQISRIDRTAEAYGKLAEKIGETSKAATAARNVLSETVKLIEFNDSLKKAIGIDTGTEAKDATSTAQFKTAANLEAIAAEKYRFAGTPGSAEAEAAVGKQYLKAAVKAETEKAEAQKRLDQLQAMQAGDMKWSLEGIPFGFQKWFRYGAMSTDDAIALEQGKINSQQSIIDSYAQFQYGAGTRAGKRAEIASGKTLAEEAAELRIEAGDNRREGIVERREDSYKGALAAWERMGQAGLARSPADAAIGMAQFMENLGVFAKTIVDANEEIKRTAEYLKTQTRKQ